MPAWAFRRFGVLRTGMARLAIVAAAAGAAAVALAQAVRSEQAPESRQPSQAATGATAERSLTPTRPDIRTLSQHFLDPKGQIAPWRFVPRENIKSLTTSEHPGMVSIFEAGRGRDVKGILDRPIRIDDYPLPWEFHLGLVQNNMALKGLSERQINYAIGLNLALTFSDPATWPSDRTKQPPDTHSTQLLVVHLGNIGENYRQGVPQVRRTPLNLFDHSPEVYLVYGRGDLAPKVSGNWNMPYVWVGPDPADSGTWSKQGGPADYVVRFRVRLASPTSLEVGIGYGMHPGWRMRNIDVSRFGKITGIWEIGPIISLDRWIPDQLAPALRLDQPPAWLEGFKQREKLLGKLAEQRQALDTLAKTLTSVDPPDPAFEYYVDYAVFYGSGPENVDHLSDDFNIPGFLADQKHYIEGNGFCETHSNPGYLTVTLYGNNGSWAMVPILSQSSIDLSGKRKAPFEIEIAFRSPDDAQPWNLWWNVGIYDDKGAFHSWQPGIKNILGQGCRFFNLWTADPVRIEPNRDVAVEFDPVLPAALLNAKPLFMLLQVQDDHRLRVGFKARKEGAWRFSKSFDSAGSFGKIARFAQPALVSFQGGLVGTRGWGTGNYPGYQKFLIDYIEYRYGMSE